MIALIDANVILNYITDREDRFRNSSKMVMDLCSQGKVDGYIAFHSLSIIWYSLRIPHEGKRMWLRDICSILTVAGASHKQVLEMYSLKILRTACRMNELECQMQTVL